VVALVLALAPVFALALALAPVLVLGVGAGVGWLVGWLVGSFVRSSRFVSFVRSLVRLCFLPLFPSAAFRPPLPLPLCSVRRLCSFRRLGPTDLNSPNNLGHLGLQRTIVQEALHIIF
jgi:hypothetical protein